MNDAALKLDTQDIVVDEVFPHTPETIWKTLTTANLMGRWLMMPAASNPWKATLHLPDDAGRRVGRHHSLPGAGGEAERMFCLCLERRA